MKLHLAETNKFLSIFLCAIVLLAFIGKPSQAQAPFWSEDPRLLPQGASALRLGGDYAKLNSKVNEFRLPAIYWKTGLGGVGEALVLFNLGESIQDGKEMGYDVETLILATKVLVHNGKGRLPEVGVGFGVKLPSQDTRKGLGPDTTDFYARAMAGADFGNTRLSVNVGLGVLEKITEALGQDDIFQYGVSSTTRLSQSRELLLEFNGHTNSTRQPTQNFFLIGMRFNRGSGESWDLACIWGLNPSADDFRVSLGYTFRFNLFKPTAPSSS